MLSGDLDRIGRQRRLEDGVPEPLEEFAREIAHLGLVLDEQHGFRPAREGGGRRGVRRFGGGVRAREIDLERRAGAGLAVDPDVPPALLDDPVHGG